MSDDIPGFSKIPNWVVRDETISGNAKLVYVVLASFNGKGGIYPSIPTIAKAARMSENTVRAANRELAALDLIVMHQQRRKDGSPGSYMFELRDNAPFSPDTTLVQPLNQGGANEKDEEEPSKKNPLRTSSAPRKTRIPEDWQPSHKARMWMIDNEFADERASSRERDQFVDFHLAKSDTSADWDRSWYTWLRNSRSRTTKTAAPTRTGADGRIWEGS